MSSSSAADQRSTVETAALPRRSAVVFAAHSIPHVGGVELYVDGLLGRLASRGWTLQLVTSDVGCASHEEIRNGVRVLRMPSAALMAARLPVPYPLPAIFRTLRAVRESRPAVVITNTRFQPLSWLGAAFATFERIPLLHIEHGSGHVPMGGVVANLVSRTIDRTAGRWVVRRAARCAGVSPASAAFLESLGAVRAAILPSGIDALERSETERRRWRERLRLAGEDVAILFLGRVTDDKGVPILLRAFRTLPTERRAHLVVAGDGNALARLRAEAANASNVHVIGRIDPTDVPGLLAACDVFAHPSMCAEGGPRTVLEAAAAGLPIVATPQGITREVVRSAEEGVLVPPGDISALASALDRLASSPSMRAALADAARRNVTDRFDWERVATDAERLLSEIAAT